MLRTRTTAIAAASTTSPVAVAMAAAAMSSSTTTLRNCPRKIRHAAVGGTKASAFGPTCSSRICDSAAVSPSGVLPSASSASSGVRACHGTAAGAEGAARGPLACFAWSRTVGEARPRVSLALSLVPRMASTDLLPCAPCEGVRCARVEVLTGEGQVTAPGRVRAGEEHLCDTNSSHGECVC